MCKSILEKYQEAQKMNEEKLAKAELVENPTPRQKRYYDKIKSQHSILEKAINRLTAQ